MASPEPTVAVSSAGLAILRSADGPLADHFDYQFSNAYIQKVHDMSRPLAVTTAQTLLAAAAADVATRAIIAGVQGGRAASSPFESAILGLQAGTTFIAPPLAAELLARAPLGRGLTRNRWANYAANSVVASAIIAGVNYPLAKAAELRAKGSATLSLREFAGLYADSVAPGIAFPAVADALEAALPAPKHSLAAFARRTAIAGAASFAAGIAAAPVAAVRDGAKIADVARQAVGAVLPGIVLAESFLSTSGIAGLVA
jgi:hypothetical protein